MLMMILARKRIKHDLYTLMMERDRAATLWAGARVSHKVALTNVTRVTLNGIIDAKNRDKDAAALAEWVKRTAGIVGRDFAKGVTLDVEGAKNPTQARDDSLIRQSSDGLAEVLAPLGVAWLFITQRDDRVCDRCSPLDGRIYDRFTVPQLPIHPRCRCYVHPIVQKVAKFSLALRP